jgi:hypothetical protein
VQQIRTEQRIYSFQHDVTSPFTGLT